MTMSKPSLSIGIPAYNEEQNIKKLTLALLSQKIQLGELKEILIVNDFSNDRTAKEVQSITDPRVRLIEQAQRSGLAVGQNRIAHEATGDILVLLDADVLPLDEYFLHEIMRPILENTAVGLVGANVIPRPGRNFFEKVLVTSHELKTDIYQQINDGSNIYLCHGRARAFSKNLYKNIHWPDKFAEDQYSYLYACSKGFKFVYAPRAVVIFRSPSSLLDHLKQSLRFIDGHKKIIREFDSPIGSHAYDIPWRIKLGSLRKYLAKKPLQTTLYLSTLLIVRLLSYVIKLKNQSSYEPSGSSKTL